MKSTKKIGIIVIMILFFLLGNETTNAQTSYSQTDYSTANGSSNIQKQQLISIPNGYVLKNALFYLGKDQTGFVWMRVHNNASAPNTGDLLTTSTNCIEITSTSTTSAFPAIFEFNNVNLTSSTGDYLFQLLSGASCGNSNSPSFYFNFYGTNTGSQSCYIGNNNCSIKSMAYTISSENLSSTETKFTSHTPTMGTTTPNATSTTFTFGSTGFINETDFIQDETKYYLRWRQITGAGKRNNPVTTAWGECEFTISNHGNFNETCTDEVLNTGAYVIYHQIYVPRFTILGFSLFKKTLIDVSGNFVVGDNIPIEEILQSQLAITTTAPTVDQKIPTEEDINTGFFRQYIDIPNLLQTKAPFSYFFQINTILTTTANNQTATTAPLLKLTFVNPNSTTTPTNIKNALTDVEVFSENTIKTYFPQTLINLFKILVSATIWVGVAMHAFTLTRRIILKQ